MFQRIATPQHLQPLGLEEPLSWADAALNRVDRDAFFARFAEADAVRYFYEPLLAAFVPELRRQLGVWYTPREIWPTYATIRGQWAFCASRIIAAL